MIVDIMSRREAIAYSKDEGILKTVIISITEPNVPDIVFADNEQIYRVLSMHFADSEENFATSIQPEQARRIVEFVLNVKDNVESILVHCEAGQSRSAGVAAALMLWLNGDDSPVWNDTFRFYPNQRCYDMVLEAIREVDELHKDSTE